MSGKRRERGVGRAFFKIDLYLKELVKTRGQHRMKGRSGQEGDKILEAEGGFQREFS